MAIYVVPSRSNRPLKDKFYDPDLLKARLDVEKINPSLLKLLQQRVDVYVWINPYAIEICETRELCGGTDRDSEIDRYYQAAEEI